MLPTASKIKLWSQGRFDIKTEEIMKEVVLTNAYEMFNFLEIISGAQIIQKGTFDLPEGELDQPPMRS